MRLAAATLLAVLVGCADEVDGVFVTANWRFRSVMSSLDQNCPQDVPYVVMHVEGSACTGTRCGPFELECEKPKPCEVEPCDPALVHSGTSGKLAEGVYDVWLEFVRADMTVFTTTTPEKLDLTLGDKTYARQIVLDGGVFKVAWTLHEGTTKRTCEEAGVSGINISALNQADPAAGNNDEVDCEAGVGFSYPYAVGTYDVSFEAVNVDGQTRGLADSLTDQVIVAPNGVTDLGTIDIQVQPNP